MDHAITDSHPRVTISHSKIKTSLTPQEREVVLFWHEGGV